MKKLTVMVFLLAFSGCAARQTKTQPVAGASADSTSNMTSTETGKAEEPAASPGRKMIIEKEKPENRTSGHRNDTEGTEEMQ
ncbi:MAG: hypothetical protein JXR95_05950 [Deltaproteobacteria bacterium]|nr:hypothetical protein [Deltaproteobacteria bacterium]